MQHIGAFIGENIPKSLKDLIELRKLWKKIVGEDVAKVSTVASYMNNTLKIVVYDNIWNEELKYLKSELLRKLNEDEGLLKFTNNNGIENITFKYEPKKILNFNEVKDSSSPEVYEITEHVQSYIDKLSSKLSSETLRERYKKMLQVRFSREDFYEWIKK